MTKRLLFIAFLFSLYATPTLACKPQTELEKTYCNIQAKSPNSLPNLQDFRNNNPKMQRLLLKRHAERLGIALPKAPLPKSKTRNNSQKPKAAPSINFTPQANKITPPKTNALKTSASKTKTRKNEHNLTDCVLKKRAIHCQRGSIFKRYPLTTNLQNKALNSGALGKQNQLTLKPAPINKDEQRQYLQDAYTIYIQKMLSIGLGASTMSFTKFTHTFLQSERNSGKKNTPFHERTQQMFEFLKKDKANIGVKSTYTSALPKNIDQCFPLNSNIIVCDNITTNWVFFAQNK
ncbi:hypothetical protein [Marinibactrum halimedae]|uniref:hypothetical protein n=1 Tax=Marinibactrum halimedae TaxID=1444977 RepID=UPI001E34DCC2|nr:hypothetical protein [Marinibactrum halimedae]MCD9459026.1 hypothetical protein [Marinibactrum halimedae]